MALLFYDGFEDLSQPDSLGIRWTGASYFFYPASYTSATSSGNTLIPPPLNGGFAATNEIFSRNTLVITQDVTSHSSGAVGVRVLYDSRLQTTYNSTTTRIIQLFDNTVWSSRAAQLCICANIKNKLEVRRGDNTGTLLGISSHMFETQTWYYIECEYTIDSINGSVIIRVDGVEVLSLSGINTQNGITSAVKSVSLCTLEDYNTGTDNSWWYDDFYIVDNTGPAPYNTFLGDIKVLSLKPDGTGSIANWTASSGTTWEAVDDVTLYNSTDFVYTSASNNTDLYTLTNLTPTGSIIYAVKSVVVARRTDTASASLAPIISTGGILYSASSDFTITTTDGEYSTTFTTNPSTSIAWTADEVNSLESGFKSTL